MVGKFFDPSFMLRTWRFSHLVRNSEKPLSETILLACSLVLSATEVDKLRSAFATGEIRLPGRSALAKVECRLHVIDLWYQQSLHSKVAYRRHWCPDSSPQLGFNFLVVVEDRLPFPISSPHEFVAALDPQGALQTKHLTLVCVAHGRGSVLHKAYCLHHMLALECGSWEHFVKARLEVRTYCSDQGIEADVCNSPCLFEEGFLNVANLREQVLSGQLQGRPLEAETALTYFLPRCMFFADGLHIVYNGLEEAVSSTAEWPLLEKYLKAIASFFSDRDARSSVLLVRVG